MNLWWPYVHCFVILVALQQLGQLGGRSVPRGHTCAGVAAPGGRSEAKGAQRAKVPIVSCVSSTVNETRGSDPFYGVNGPDFYHSVMRILAKCRTVRKLHRLQATARQPIVLHICITDPLSLQNQGRIALGISSHLFNSQLHTSSRRFPNLSKSRDPNTHRLPQRPR